MLQQIDQGETEREDENKISNFDSGKEVFNEVGAAEGSGKIEVGFVEDNCSIEKGGNFF